MQKQHQLFVFIYESTAPAFSILCYCLQEVPLAKESALCKNQNSGATTKLYKRKEMFLSWWPSLCNKEINVYHHHDSAFNSCDSQNQNNAKNMVAICLELFSQIR